MDIKEFLENDRYAKYSGINLLDVRPGYARASMEVKEMHLNAGNSVQGGALFTLADLAFAAAINSYGNLAVSVETSIRFFKAVSEGVLYAEARQVHLHKKLATFEVFVTDCQGERVALFTATAFRKNVALPITVDEAVSPDEFA